MKITHGWTIHKAHKKELALNRLGAFKQLILIVDTIFDFEMYSKENLMSDFTVIELSHLSLHSEINL